MTKALIVAELALSVVLLAGAALLIESASRFASAPLGFERRGLMTASVNLPPQRYATASGRVEFFDRMLDRVGALPGMQRVALSSVLPLQTGRGSRVLIVDGRPEPPPGQAVHDISVQSVTPEYFALMNVQRLKGRAFDADDREGTTPVAIVDEALAKKYFSTDDPVGRRIRFLAEPGEVNPWLTVVGVVANEKRTTPYTEMEWADTPTVYRPLAQRAVSNDAVLLLRAASADSGLGAAVAKAVTAVDAGVVVGGIRTADQLVDRYIAHPRFRAALLGSFAAIALMLAAVGLYAVLAQLVAFRTREIGVRMALGARQIDVLVLVVREGMLLAAAGMFAGIVAALGLTRFLVTLLYGVQPHDAATLAAVSAVLLAAAFLATYLPARRAARVDPMIALRCE
jgi:putative ABC transport system permease protein